MVNGKLPVCTALSVAAAKNVDLPTFAFPNRPTCMVVCGGVLIYCCRGGAGSGAPVRPVHAAPCGIGGRTGGSRGIRTPDSRIKSPVLYLAEP